MIEFIVFVIVGAIITTIAVRMERARQKEVAEAQYELIAKNVCFHSVRDTIFAVKEQYKIEDDADAILEHVKAYVRKKAGEANAVL